MPRRKRLLLPSPSPGVKRRGNPDFKPTDEQRAQVELMAGFGIPQVEICRLVINPYTKRPIDHKTLTKWFSDEIDAGFTKAKFRVIGGLFKNATTPTDQYPGGIPTAQIFWLKTQGGPAWREQPRLPDDSPGMTPAEADEASPLERARRVAFLLVSGIREKSGNVYDASRIIQKKPVKTP